MEIALTEAVAVTDASSIGEARRAAQTIAQRLDFEEVQAGELALLATEASRNVLVHGGGGQLILTGTKSEGSSMARILAVDSGPGIADMARAMTDGFSTAGTPGGGMGAMRRIASRLDIFTGRTGTIVLLEVGQVKQNIGQAEPNFDLQIAGMALPYPGERTCGDSWAHHRAPDRTLVMIADGLGHGIGAAEASQEAMATFQAHVHLGPGQILGLMHDALRKTRGAVAGIAEIRPTERVMIFAGVGNISAVLMSGNSSRSIASHNGTLGATASRIQEFRSDWSSDAILILHSDGLQTRWDLSVYAGLLSRHPAVIGGALMRDFRRQKDDASVVVVKAA
jgi:anti-sigma regulatory factor (Ser/Thr protein kinase)